ncbi:MAG: nitroreductase family protein [Candidatus Omnitrophica bacterium]|nr:nitroreductase family protein [Candidatus Omnitrophota bacterium]
MDALEALASRRSVRAYEDKPVSKQDIEKIIDAARFAPTANNVQPWEFVVITDKKTRAEIASIAEYGRFIADAPVCVVVFCKDTKYYLEDGCAATENILVSACALGLGSCWVAGDKKTYASRIAQVLGVPHEYKLISLLSIGYPKVKSQPYGKRQLEEVMHWEKF